MPLSMLANVAEDLRDDEMHVWRVDYRPPLGRAPLFAVLSAYLGVPADEIGLLEGEHGRPFLAPAHDSTLGFNWSHSGSDALIVVGQNVVPGIDIERSRERPRALEIAQRYFTPDEASALAALPLDERHAAFLELWTAKEAVLKALGRGIAFGLHRLSIGSGDSGFGLRELEGEQISDWQLERLSPGTSLIAALAWRGEPRRIRQGVLAIGE